MMAQQWIDVGSQYKFRDYSREAPPPVQAAPFANPIPYNMRGPYQTQMTTSGQHLNVGCAPNQTQQLLSDVMFRLNQIEMSISQLTQSLNRRG